MGKVGLVGIGWASTLTLNLFFTGALALFFFSAFLGTRDLLVCGSVWSWRPGLPSSSKYVFIFLIRDGPLFSRGCMV